MENVIILMLFTYPGAIMDRVFAIASAKYDYHKSLDGSALAARYLIYSALCTTISILILSLTLNIKDGVSLAAIVGLLQATNLWWKYLLISFVVSILCGLASFCIHHFILRNIRNKILIPKGHYKDSGTKDTWQHIINHPDEFDLWNCAIVIRKDGHIVAAGLPYALPKDHQEARYALMHCDKVLQELNTRAENDETSMLGETMLNYYDATNDYMMEFIYAPRLWDKVQNG